MKFVINKTLLLIIIAIFTSSFIFSSQTAQVKKYTYVVNPDGNPYEYISRSGYHRGMTSDYLWLINKNIDFKLSLIKTSSWEESKTYVKTDRADILFASSRTPSRKKWLNFTKSYLIINSSAVVRKNSKSITKLSDIINKKIVTVKGYSIAKKLIKDYPNVDISYTENIFESLLVVSRGEADVAFLNLPIASYHIQQNLLTNLRVIDIDKYYHDLSIGVRKTLANSQEIVDKLNIAIDNMSDNKSDILNRWVQTDYRNMYIDDSDDDNTTFYVVLAFLSLMFPMVLYGVKMKKLNLRLNILATTDTLTGAHNRRYIEDITNIEISKVLRSSANLSFMMFDIDKFKNFNDSYGHAAGDKALQVFTKTIQTHKRKSDIFGRIGGEEFCIIAMDTSLDNTCFFANKLRVAIEEAKIVINSGEILKMTVSIGVSTFEYENDSFEALMARADEGLYKAKNNGRNRVEKYGS